MNIRNDNGMAKAYQVRQVIKALERQREQGDAECVDPRGAGSQTPTAVSRRQCSITTRTAYLGPPRMKKPPQFRHAARAEFAIRFGERFVLVEQ